jgi:sporulation protein YlmC with PRC-barrel domain
MSHYGLLKDYKFSNASEDIRGATLYGANDEKLGKIDDVIFDHSSGDIAYLVVDTGGWLTIEKFIVPAIRLRPSTKHENDFNSDLTKEQIESFPPYKESDVESEDKWKDYEGRYRSKWDSGPVMHREGSDRNITPTTHQMQGNQSSLRASGDVSRSGSTATSGSRSEDAVRAASASTGRIIPAGTDTIVISNSAAGIGARWDTFQARLRERRKEAAMGCGTCSIGPASSRDPLKKAV